MRRAKGPSGGNNRAVLEKQDFPENIGPRARIV